MKKGKLYGGAHLNGYKATFMDERSLPNKANLLKGPQNLNRFTSISPLKNKTM